MNIHNSQQSAYHGSVSEILVACDHNHIWKFPKLFGFENPRIKKFKPDLDNFNDTTTHDNDT